MLRSPSPIGTVGLTTTTSIPFRAAASAACSPRYLERV